MMWGAQALLCANLEGWDGVGGGDRGSGGWACVCLWLIVVDVWQKVTQRCKEIIHRTKLNFSKRGPRVYMKRLSLTNDEIVWIPIKTLTETCMSS